MGNKIRSITILFDEDVTEKYIDYIENTALCYKHVMKVERDISGSVSEWAVESRVDDKWREKIKELLYSK